MSDQEQNDGPQGWPPMYPAPPPSPQPSAYPGPSPMPQGYPGAGYQAGYGVAEVLPGSGQAVPPQRKRRRGVIIAGAVTVGVAGVVAGSAYAYSHLNGGGDQPEQHLPSTSAFVARVDLDPSLSQKVDVLRFASKFPATPKDLDWNAVDRDPRKWVYEELTKDTSDAPPWSEVDGWLGKRAAFAMTPGSPEAVPLAVIQVTDEAKASASLTRTKTKGRKIGFVAKDGWVLVSDTQAHADTAMAAAESSPLSSSSAFKDDVDALGDQGIASAWFDYAGLSKIGKTSGSSGLFGLGGGLGSTLAGRNAAAQLVTGHGAVALRFSGANLELAGRLRGLGETWKIGSLPAAKVNLPADTLGVVQIAGLGDAITKAWPDLVKQFGTLSGTDPDELTSQLEQQVGLKLPEDLTPLLGDESAVAMRATTGQKPEFGLRVDSSSPDTKRVSSLVSRAFRGSGEAITVKQFSGGYAIG
jgi:hypothetical protein